MIELLTAATAAGISPEFQVMDRQRPATILAPGLSGAEAVTIEFFTGFGWLNLSIDGVLQQLTPTNNAITFYGPLRVRANKPATVVPVPIMVATDVFA